jgi:hypothetical protein
MSNTTVNMCNIYLIEVTYVYHCNNYEVNPRACSLTESQYECDANYRPLISLGETPLLCEYHGVPRAQSQDPGYQFPVDNKRL